MFARCSLKKKMSRDISIYIMPLLSCNDAPVMHQAGKKGLVTYRKRITFLKAYRNHETAVISGLESKLAMMAHLMTFFQEEGKKVK